MIENTDQCFICLRGNGLTKCKKCQLWMCLRHSRVHKDKLKDKCFPFKVEMWGEMGRVLVATRNIKKGEVICREEPAIVGPYSRSKPQCLHCFKVFDPGHKYTCNGCGYPMCDLKCSRGKYHVEECQLFREAGFKAVLEDMESFDSQYSAIAVLRLLLLLDKEVLAEERGSNIHDDYLLCLSKSLMDHNEERRSAQPEIWQFEEEFMVKFIRQTCNLSQFSSEEIHGCNGRILMNATSLEFTDDSYGRGAGLFPIYSMMNTSCRNNTKSYVLPDHSVEILAKTKIRAGEEITNQYHKPDTATFLRRQTMREKWFFDCACLRCKDPTELGTHFGSILCPISSCKGSITSLNTDDNESDWGCTLCGKEVTAEFVRTIISEAEAVINNPASRDGPVEHFERVLDNLGTTLHQGHYLMLDVKQKLAMLYGNVMPYTMDKMKRPARERKAQLCREVIWSLSKLEAGLSTWHIAMLMELAKLDDSNISQENSDPDGRKGMMAKFMLMDKVLTSQTCLQFAD